MVRIRFIPYLAPVDDGRLHGAEGPRSAVVTAIGSGAAPDYAEMRPIQAILMHFISPDLVFPAFLTACFTPLVVIPAIVIWMIMGARERRYEAQRASLGQKTARPLWLMPKGMVVALATLAALLGFVGVVVLMIEILSVPSSSGGGPDRASTGLGELLAALVLGVPIGGGGGGMLAYLVLRFCWQPSRGYRHQAADRRLARQRQRNIDT